MGPLTTVLIGQPQGIQEAWAPALGFPLMSLIVAEEEKVLENQLNHNPVAENVAETLDPILAIKRQVDFLIAPDPPPRGYWSCPFKRAPYLLLAE